MPPLMAALRTRHAQILVDLACRRTGTMDASGLQQHSDVIPCSEISPSCFWRSRWAMQLANAYTPPNIAKLCSSRQYDVRPLQKNFIVELEKTAVHTTILESITFAEVQPSALHAWKRPLLRCLMSFPPETTEQSRCRCQNKTYIT